MANKLRHKDIPDKQCEVCGLTILRNRRPIQYKKARFCNNLCRGIHQTQEKVGKNNPNWKGGRPKCLNCGNEVVNRKAKYCNECRDLANCGENSHNWKGGLTETQKLEKKAGRSKPEDCEVCGAMGKICYDHDHKSGQFRGWICWRCNIILGHARDSVDLMEKLSDYLKKHNG